MGGKIATAFNRRGWQDRQKKRLPKRDDVRGARATVWWIAGKSLVSCITLSGAIFRFPRGPEKDGIGYAEERPEPESRGCPCERRPVPAFSAS